MLDGPATLRLVHSWTARKETIPNFKGHWLVGLVSLVGFAGHQMTGPGLHHDRL